MNAILGGHIDLTDSNLTQKGKVDAGQLQFLAIATEKRDPEIAERADLEGARHQRRLRGRPRPARARRARRPTSMAKLEAACASGGQGAGVRRRR